MNIEERLRNVIEDDIKRRAVAALLECACNYGAGDAYAGAKLKTLRKEDMLGVCILLKINWPDAKGGPFGAMTLLEQKSDIPEVTELLKELDNSALSGNGIPWAK